MAKAATKQLVVCIKNDGYPASLERHKIYRVLPDSAAEKDGDIRIIENQLEGASTRYYSSRVCLQSA